MTSQNKIEVIIDDIKYTLVADTEGDRTKRIAEYVDSKIASIREANSRLNQSMVYVLTMMNISGDFFDKREKYDQLVEESKEPIQRFQSISDEHEKVKQENIELEDAVEKLKDDLVTSLNTISDMNRRFTALKDENLKNVELLKSKDNHIKEISANLAKMQEEISKLEKLYQESVLRISTSQVKGV